MSPFLQLTEQKRHSISLNHRAEPWQIPAQNHPNHSKRHVHRAFYLHNVFT